MRGDEDVSPYLGGTRLACVVLNECATTCLLGFDHFMVGVMVGPTMTPTRGFVSPS